MVMIPETMNDILAITRQWHHALSEHLSKSAHDTPSERNQLLLEYVAEHEEKLARTLDVFQRETDLGPLDTWFYEYTDRHKIIHSDPSDIPFASMSSQEVAAELANLHDQLIDLYFHLHERAESHSAKEVLTQLLDVEKSKGKLISFESGRAQEF